MRLKEARSSQISGTSPVYEHMSRPVRLRSFGNELQYDPRYNDLAQPARAIQQHAQNLGARNVLWQRLANDKHPDNRFAVFEYYSNLYHPSQYLRVRDFRADGVILNRPGDAVALSTRDCPVLTLYSIKGGPIAVLHCSRSSLQGVDCGDPKRSVIVNAMRAVGYAFADRKSVRGCITMGIAPQHFHNERYPNIVARLRRVWGTDWGNKIIGDSPTGPTIDLVALIHAQLDTYRINLKMIEHDGLDTFTDERLASVRAKRGGHNLTLVMHQGTD